MAALLFGSISTLADTSELQRQAFNDAFAAHGLGWRWDRDDYRARLDSNGGAQRIAQYAQEQGVDVDADAVHATKSELFQKAMAQGVTARPGVLDTIRAAKDGGLKVGLVTTTTPENITALLDALNLAGTFDVVTDLTDVEQGKPDPAVYAYALQQLGEQASDAYAVEDNAGGVRSAKAADVAVVAFPNENTAGTDLGAPVVESLDLETVRTTAA